MLQLSLLVFRGIVSYESYVSIFQGEVLWSLRPNLKSLTFGLSFNQSLARVSLPDSLETLSFGDCFDQSLVGVKLPRNLQSLTFGFDARLNTYKYKLPLKRFVWGTVLEWKRASKRQS